MVEEHRINGKMILFWLLVIIVEISSMRIDLNEQLLKKVLQRKQDKKITIQLINNHVEFKVPMVVQGIQYNLTIDSGSNAFFIKGEQSLGNPTRKYHSNVDYKSKFKLHQLSYMDGTVKLYQQSLKVSFAQFNQLQMPILVAYKSTTYFSAQDGLIGLSFPEEGLDNYSFLRTLVNQGLIQKQIFGVNINLIDTSRSYITFGGADANFYQDTLEFYPFIDRSQFSISLNGVSLEQNRIMNIDEALLDTGTTCFTFPLEEQNYLTRVFNTGGNKCGWLGEGQDRSSEYDMLMCRISNFSALPTIRIFIQEELYTFPPQYYLQYCLQHYQYYYCDTYIQVGATRINAIVLGDAFFNRYYTVFDLEDAQVGIGRNRENIWLQQLMTLKDKDTSFDKGDWNQLIQNIKIM